MPDEKVKTGAAGEDSYSAKTHLHQPVVAPETATVAATACRPMRRQALCPRKCGRRS